MGIYIYSLKKSSLKQILIGGNPVEAACLSFHHKPSMWHYSDKAARLTEARLTHSENAWAGNTSSHVVLYKFEEGADVLANWPKGKCVWNDAYELPGTVVGTLHKVGRRWTVKPLTYRVADMRDRRLADFSTSPVSLEKATEMAAKWNAYEGTERFKVVRETGPRF